MPGGIFEKKFGGILGAGGCGGRVDDYARGGDGKKGCFVTSVRAGCFKGDFDLDKVWL
jgi:hypothetical protein